MSALASERSVALLDTLLDISLTAVALLRPLYADDNRLTDFAWVYLNPAGQQMLRQPEVPAASLLTLFPTAVEDGVFAKCHQAFLTGEAQRNETLYQADGPDGYFLLTTQRSGDLLVVNFTHTNYHLRTPVEQALRASQARERAARAEAERLNQELTVAVQVAERARAEAERQRGELERVFEQAPIAIAVYRGPSYTIELANPTVARLWGRTREQLLGKGLFEALPEVAGMGYEELLDGVMATGEPHVAHAMEAHHDRNGQRETVYWDFVYVPMYAADGRINGAMVVATEVTAQVQARRQVEHLNQALEARVQARTRELAEQQQLLSQILGHVPAAIATLRGPEHRFSFFNEHHQRLNGHRAVLGATVREVAPEAVEQGFLALLDHVYQTGQPHVGSEVPVWVTLPPIADPYYADFRYQPLHDERGQVQGILVFAVDVTERVRARQEHEAQQRLVETVFQQAPAGIWVAQGPAHVFELINPQMERLLGRSREQVLGRPYFEVLPELVGQGVPALLRQVWESGQSIMVEEFAVQLAYHAPNEPGYFTFVFEPLRNEQGQVVRIACVALEVSPQVLARRQVQALNEELATLNQDLIASNERLRNSNAQLTRSNADLDSFVYSASHDLKAPIANVEGLLHALHQELPPALLMTPTIARVLHLMADAVARFQQTLLHLTHIVQLERTDVEEAQEVALEQLINDVCLDLAPAIDAAQAQVLVDTQQCAWVRVAPKSLRSIVFNLVSNALKYRVPERTPTVHVRVACQDQQIHLSVQDNGLGLTPAQQGHLFKLFRRLHPGVEGSGVGLYTVKKIVDNAGGTITVHSEVGVGTTFSILLPGANRK
ncbi:PAS domain-containing sensor histidine kinase [Hymenobacter sp. GOD-10R]|uniref:PAS domain-containing sensor histidine kinase n=1 Tax=Hymenobacter sp. GOD-10R TaxID=3093922 RepID=UPI002D78D8B3|nr:PAS domain-containing sensor histidine kinase [Hymenobacter sp. GOD-10R]WRQ27092.1 PAS domain-containing sensor histidine kinase [Hymenobacter sp. GOD-10R]